MSAGEQSERRMSFAGCACEIRRITMTAYTVTQMNSYIKNMFRQDFVLSKVSVKGEISNCKYHTSGHIYFTLKDESGVLSAVMFAGSAAGLRFRLENGLKVVVSGRIDVYERDGKYQLYATSVEADGLGDLYKKFEQLKAQFEEMGYFAKEYKRPIPEFSKKIGIVTASTGAAIHDIMNIAHRRNPYVALYLYPALVQGAGAAQSIVKGIKTLDEMGMDVIIVGRGGGSIEDLWAFNEEIVAEAIFNAKTPIISAVGHETDFTIADFVADMRAPTPSAAAELSVADVTVIEDRIENYRLCLEDVLRRKIERYRERLNAYLVQFKYLNPKTKVEENRIYAASLQDKLDMMLKNIVFAKRHQLELYASRLQGVSPLEKLSQGYSYVEKSDKSRIMGIKDIKNEDMITVYFKDGKADAQVKEVYNG